MGAPTVASVAICATGLCLRDCLAQSSRRGAMIRRGDSYQAMVCDADRHVIVRLVADRMARIVK
jgi:hypothetical protein